MALDFIFNKREYLVKKKIDAVKSIVQEYVPECISLMITGSRAFPSEITKNSDLDLLLIISKGKSNSVRRFIYDRLSESYPHLETIHTWIIVHNLCEFNKIPKKASSESVWSIRFIKKYAEQFIVILGTKIDFISFPVEPITLREEARKYYSFVHKIISLRNESKDDDFDMLIKYIIKLIGIEFQHNNPNVVLNTMNYGVITRFNCLKKNSLLDLAMKYRKKGGPYTFEEKQMLLKLSVPYVKHYSRILKKL